MVDRLVLKTMTVDSPKAQLPGGKPHLLANALGTTRSTYNKTRMDGGSASPKTMTVDSPKAQLPGGKPHLVANSLRTTRST